MVTPNMNQGILPPENAGRDEQASAIARADRPSLPKRFYQNASVEFRDGAYNLLLDGRTARTPGRAPLAVPDAAIADILAQEWRDQVETINPANMPMTRLVNSVIDGVARARAEVIAETARYAGSDLLCYRANAPERLMKRQAELWDPVLEWAYEKFSARFVLSEGVMFVAQPEGALVAIEQAITSQSSAYALGGMHVLTTLGGSVLLALAIAHKRLSVEEAWLAAHVDEDVQAEIWGADEEALQRRANRYKEFKAAAMLVHHTWDAP